MNNCLSEVWGILTSSVRFLRMSWVSLFASGLEHHFTLKRHLEISELRGGADVLGEVRVRGLQPKTFRCRFLRWFLCLMFVQNTSQTCSVYVELHWKQPTNQPWKRSSFWVLDQFQDAISFHAKNNVITDSAALCWRLRKLALRESHLSTCLKGESRIKPLGRLKTRLAIWAVTFGVPSNFAGNLGQAI